MISPEENIQKYDKQKNILSLEDLNNFCINLQIFQEREKIKINSLLVDDSAFNILVLKN